MAPLHCMSSTKQNNFLTLSASSPFFRGLHNNPQWVKGSSKRLAIDWSNISLILIDAISKKALFHLTLNRLKPMIMHRFNSLPHNPDL